jgi:DNA repair exonuclease SbcCD ATPase subunit
VTHIKKIEIQGFRAFGRKAQGLVLPSLIGAVWGPNSSGKTSLAEAFEFLLTGQIVRRELMGSSQDEFTDALTNAHLPLGTEVFVQAEIVGSDAKAHTIKRVLRADYGKKQDCQTRLEIDGKEASEKDLNALGIPLSQPPLRAPVLAQHTLGYLFSARPQDRADYFKALLEVTDVEAFRNVAAGLGANLIPPSDPPILEKLGTAARGP